MSKLPDHAAHPLTAQAASGLNGSAGEARDPSRKSSPLSSELRWWLLATLLALPAAIPYLSHYLQVPPGYEAIGVVQPDQVSYMANAREHFDRGFSLLYRNPYAADPGAPEIYFQPQTLLLGVVHEFSGLPPMVVFNLFGLLAAVVCSRVAIGLYRELIGLGGFSRQLGLVLFFWGGGLLCLGGLAATWWQGGPLLQPPDEYGFPLVNYLRFDPHNGWWFLNFGRNLVYPLESYYHAMFFGCVLCLLRQRWAAGLSLAGLAAISHPFTGLELLAVITLWGGLESLRRRRGIPARRLVLIGGVVGLALLLAYYKGILPLFPSHNVVQAQHTGKPWLLPRSSMALAYALVGGLALWRIGTPRRWRRFWAQPRHRLLVAWCLAAVLLAKHELFIEPRLPLHFTRGYIWTSLFFIAAPALLAILRSVPRVRPVSLQAVLLSGVLLLGLFDNAMWFAQFIWRPPPYHARETLMEVQRYLGQDERSKYLVLSPELSLGYLATAYSPHRVWLGHGIITPHYNRRRQELIDLFQRGRFLERWDREQLMVVFPRAYLPSLPPWLRQRLPRAKGVLRNDDYVVVSVRPEPPKQRRE